MAETAQTTTTEATTSATTTTAAAPWYQGADAELVGHITNKGWNAKPVNDVALEAIRAHREAEKLIGVPASQIVRLPTDPNDEAAWKGVWQRLGAPANGKDGYDFSTIKDPAGQPVASPLLDRIKDVAAALNLPKDTATRLASELVKYDQGRTAETEANTAAKLVEQRAALDKNWGANAAVNKIIAQQAAAKFANPEAVAALEGVIGYDKVMEMFRQIGAATGEDRFVKDPSNQQPGVMSRDQAQAQLNELKKDEEFVARYMKGDTAAVRQMTSLHTILAA